MSPQMAPPLLPPFAVPTYPAPAELCGRALAVHLTQRKRHEDWFGFQRLKEQLLLALKWCPY